jgi:hypothetical protein
MNTNTIENQGNAVSLLNLAPRLNCPLSPWNILDYLRLLYWAFFFPQALRWYVKAFGKSEYLDIKKSKIVEVLIHDPVQRLLMIQALAALLIAAMSIALGLSVLGVSMNWIVLAAGVALGVMFGGMVGVLFGIDFGVTFGLTFGVVGSIFGGATFGWGGSLQAGPAFGAVLGISLGAAVGLALVGAGSVKSGVDDDAMKVVTGGMTFMMAGGVIFAVTSVITLTAAGVTTAILVSNLKVIALFSIGLGTAFSVSLSRLPDYIPLALAGTLYWHDAGKRRVWLASRVLFLPLPGIQKQLENWLNSDWETGLHNANQLLAYTLQFTPAVKAINAALARASNDTLLSMVNALADQPYDWDLIRFCSVSLKNQLWQKAIEGFFFLFPKRKKRQPGRFSLEPRIDTPARAACAGFWYWHQEESEKAAQAFANLQELRHGSELYYIASAIHLGLLVENEKDEIKGIADWEQKTRRLKNLSEPVLRRDTLEVLQTLRTVAGDTTAASSAWSPYRRSIITIRIIETLKQLIDEGEKICPHPEWLLIKRVIQKWHMILTSSGWIISKDELGPPVDNPYEGYSGRPVTSVTFVGREDIMRRIEKHWAAGGLLEPLVLFGHRRMGKTSILHSLRKNTEANILLVYMTMQDVGLVDHQGQLFLEFAEAIHRVAVNVSLPIVNLPKEEEYTALGTGRRALNALLDKMDPHMSGKRRLVLAIDEFEIIIQNIEEKRIDKGFLNYLRSLIQNYNWLGLIFAGMHTLEEMGQDYRAAFYGQVECLQVGYLERDDAIRLITHPHPRFALEYSTVLLEELYRLTFGQPYLIQRLCWELVTLWNERSLKHRDKILRTLTHDDLSFVLTSDFFKSADYYFNGVWSNVTENEQALMRILAGHEKETRTIDELAAAVKYHPSFAESGTTEKTIELLLRHDVIIEEENGYRFASELMRRWVAGEKLKTTG